MRRRAIRVSLSLNFALALLLFLFLLRRPYRESPPTHTSPAPPASVETETSSLTSTPIYGKPPIAVFQWSQLDSADYREYVSNLRKIGCPEATLRAIVTSDLDAVYDKRSRELERQLTDLKNAPLSVRLNSLSTEQALRDQLQRLSAEENSQIADLLGLNSGSAPATPDLAAAGPVVTEKRSARVQTPPQMPMVFQNVDPSAMKLNADQMQAIEDLRQSFTDQVGGPDQDPNDPAYLTRWQKAQPQVDSQLRGMLGVKVYEQYEMAIQPPQDPSSQKP